MGEHDGRRDLVAWRAVATAKPTAEASKPGTLVHLPRQAPPPELDDPRLSDVDEWGRSEHIRELARRLYAPIYDKWFRVEWEGLENIPAEGARCSWPTMPPPSPPTPR